MKKLTIKQEKFSQLVASGVSKTEAYRQAYDSSGMKPGTLWVEAVQTSKLPNVSQRISQLRSEMLEDMYNSTLWSREEAVKATKRAMLRAEKKGKNNEVYKAVEILNNMHGFNAPIKLDHASSDGSIGGAVALTNEQLAEELKKRNLPTGFLDE